jgi:alpha-galactosidase
VENLYTYWGNYYPHATLRNLWQLSRYLPTERMQFEVLNLRRNKEKYNDILGPDNYDMDYAFACVMAAKPLVWMEMTGLNEEDTARLQKIAAVFKAYRDDFMDVEPIGTCPTGYALTGFRITGKKNDYLLLLRENTESSTWPVELKEILATNDESAGLSPATLTKPRSYLFGIIKK